MTDRAGPFRLDPDALDCPYPHYEELRRRGRSPFVDAVQARVVTGYADVREVMHHADVASSRTPTGPGNAQRIGERIGEAVRDSLLTTGAAGYLARPHDRTLFTIDPAQHTH